MLYGVRAKLQNLDHISIIFILAAAFVSTLLIQTHYDTQVNQLKLEVSLYRDALASVRNRIVKPRYPFAIVYDKMDYHNYKFMEQEAAREGPGEQGKPYVLAYEDDVERSKELFDTFGFNVIASDHISVNRSLPDIRPVVCRSKKYLKSLPDVSIVIVFYNEYFSMLARTLHSIYNRTPHFLVREIILVNDNSTLPELNENLKEYTRKHFGELVKHYVLTERMGMIKARMEGAKIAKGQVLVFLDAHVEVNVNWLPPLLEPIALDGQMISTPVIDYFKADTFEYKKLDDGGRGIFNWDLQYRRAPRRPEDTIYVDAPIPSPMMIGSAFAINRNFFWDLGAYDTDLKVWQGEQYEMSFKAHLCGKGMVEVPCSRVAHSYKKKNYYTRFENGTDFAARNLKRIAEVWMDEFKEVVYSRSPARYENLDAGNVRIQKAIRQGLYCKPFRYYLEYVAPEILFRYPLENRGYFARGAIQSRADPRMCIQVSSEITRPRKLGLSECSEKIVDPGTAQMFTLAWHRNIQHDRFDYCIVNSLVMYECHFTGGNEFWKYDIDTYQIVNPLKSSTKCLTLNTTTNALSLEVCDETDINQKWNWGEKNLSALSNWDTFGVRISRLRTK